MGNFTDTYIRNLKGKDKRYEEYEGGGFGIRVTPNQLKSWIYRYKIGKKTDKITLGHYPSMSLADARKKFIELSELRRSGQAPKKIIQIQNEKKNNTMDQLINSWYQGYVIKNRKKPLQIKQQIEADIIPLLGHLELEKIKPIDITNALDAIVKRGAPIHANRVLSSLKQVFNYAISRGSLETNPAANIKARNIGGIEKPSERFLALDEIKTLWQFLNSDQSKMSLQTKSAIKIILLTGVRTAEIRLAQWSHFDFANSLWTIPSELTKGGITVKIHLSELTKSIILKLNEGSDSSFVLSGLVPNKPLDENALPRAIRRIQKRVGIPEWSAHDLRRTFATQLGETLHIDPVVIEKCLGHKMPRIMATYNKNEMLPQRKEALERWSKYIQELVGHSEENSSSQSNLIMQTSENLCLI
ncbi:tyrosine-type recombinase/integrase [Legionella pneumophila]|uniref:tyrosine-type recombinase/integrase n=1 Tax=Legionella pneumophila TaxID=446 RepID=UPI000777D00A|nr:site-specific integrase [Legionella pneumophila]HAT8656771.1 tyrosine-type recombinase/integrase [Legionella pneumophila]